MYSNRIFCRNNSKQGQIQKKGYKITCMHPQPRYWPGSSNTNCKSNTSKCPMACHEMLCWLEDRSSRTAANELTDQILDVWFPRACRWPAQACSMARGSVPGSACTEVLPLWACVPASNKATCRNHPTGMLFRATREVGVVHGHSLLWLSSAKRLHSESGMLGLDGQGSLCATSQQRGIVSF